MSADGSILVWDISDISGAKVALKIFLALQSQDLEWTPLFSLAPLSSAVGVDCRFSKIAFFPEGFSRGVLLSTTVNLSSFVPDNR